MRWDREPGAEGGRVIAQGTPTGLGEDPRSLIGPYLSGKAEVQVRERAEESRLFEAGEIRLSTGSIHTVQPLEVRIPKGRLTAVTGVSGSGKTTLILESLVPALTAAAQGKKLPEHVRDLQAEGIRQVKLIDASPIGINIRSTVATYANVHDELRKVFARTPDAREQGRKAGDFSYNTGKLRCPVCDGTGVISLDVQFLPDVQIPCPQCRGTRYGKEAESIRYRGSGRQVLFPAGAHGYGCEHSPSGLCRTEKCLPEIRRLKGSGAGIPDSGRRNAGPLRRRSPAAEAGQ